MKVINIKDYNSSLGKLIDVEESIIYNQKHINGAINIPLETLLYQRDRLLNKSETYYIYCQGGRKAKRACTMLEVYGYKTVLVLLN